MIHKIAVIGAGTMGHGIAEVFAMHGYDVRLCETYAVNMLDTVKAQMQAELEFMAGEDYIPAALVQETLNRVSLHSELERAVADADFVIEAVAENLAVKKGLFAQLDKLCPAHTIFASNTSSLPLRDMMADLPAERQARYMVCHWYNPAHLIPIAELSCFGNMDEDVFREVYELHVNAGKKPIRVLKDIPGLVANRILHALAREVFHLIEIGAASPEDIDRALKFGPGFRSATTGILESADMGGLDVWCAVEDNLFPELDSATAANSFLRGKVEQSKLGLKSGEGFYEYPEEIRQQVREAFNRRLLAQLKVSRQFE